MRIIADADLLAAATAAGRDDLLADWQHCPDCGGPAKPGFWRPRWAADNGASYGIICPLCPDRPETPIREWALEEN